MILNSFLVSFTGQRFMQARVSQSSFSVEQLSLGTTAHICQLHGDRRMIQRMNMLGIRRGSAITIVHGPGKRGAVLKVGGARIALGPEVIKQIEVTVTPTVRTDVEMVESL